jgi:hypothetical protein
MVKGNAKAFDAALKSAQEAFDIPAFRQWLYKNAQRGFELAAPSGNAKALEFKMLIRALER